jgi:hypothetical protein|tara:strand:- start:492 stop:1154 length:663 start_codon:yes stop_codon:yes gene_type:complete
VIYTLSTYHVDRADLTEFVRVQEEEVWPKLGTVPLGLWSVVMGGPRRVLMLCCYDSLQHWQSTCDWNVAADSGVASAGPSIFDATEAVALRPLTRRRPTAQAPESEAGIYTMRTFKVAGENLRRFVEVSEDGWWPWVEAGQGLRPLAQWVSIVAPETRVYMMARYDDMAHWEATRQVGTKPDDPELVPIWETASAAIAERQTLVIDTNVCMLLPISQRRP